MSKSPPVNAAAPAPERLIFESGSPGRSAFFWDEDEPPLTPLPEVLVRSEIAGFPELGELEAIRHFTRLSQQNFGIESQFYPLGSCTMKYNPKVNEAVARLDRFEGATYARSVVTVRLHDHRLVEAAVYLASAGARPGLSRRRWTAAEFRDRCLSEILPP